MTSLSGGTVASLAGISRAGRELAPSGERQGAVPGWTERGLKVA